MSYTTKFSGCFRFDRELKAAEAAYLVELASVRHDRERYPGVYCAWVLTEDRTGLEADENADTEYVAWLHHLVDKVFELWDLGISGEVAWQGEEMGDVGVIRVKDNEITVVNGEHPVEVPEGSDQGEEPYPPLQPLDLSPFRGGIQVPRFRSNAIVDKLLEDGPFDMNAIALWDVPDEDREQFAMLIGYSISGFAELSYVREETVKRAGKVARERLPDFPKLWYEDDEALADWKAEDE